MPLYEYECRRCHHRFEQIRRFSDPPIRKCPRCRTGKVDKLISAPAVRFKGSGWYVTDYAGKGKADKAEKGEKTEKSDTAEKADKPEKSDVAGKTDKAEKDGRSGKEPKADKGGKHTGKD